VCRGDGKRLLRPPRGVEAHQRANHECQEHAQEQQSDRTLLSENLQKDVVCLLVSLQDQAERKGAVRLHVTGQIAGPDTDHRGLGPDGDRA
jgi:hypothetical protein